MRCVSRVAGALALAALTSMDVSVARADIVIAARENPSFLFFSGTDLWRHGSFTFGGLLWSPQGVDHSGFTFKALIGGGSYRYLSGALGDIEVTGDQIVGFALPGWRFRSGSTFLTLFAGLDVQHHRTRPFDPSNTLRGTHAGLRAAAEFWMEPSTATMLAADASVSTVGPSYSARGAFGWKLFDKFYLGPEAQAFQGDDTYRQWRLGLHVTGLKAYDFEWSAAIGYANDTDDRDSLYGRIGLLLRR
jgi:hypothetical protein